MALWSMILGIIGWVAFLLSACSQFLIVPLAILTIGFAALLNFLVIPLACISPIAWLLAVVFGHIGKGQIRMTGEEGRGMASAGQIMGYVGIGLTVLTVCALIFLAITGGLAGLIAWLTSINSGYYY
jgi:hypothetical protein